MTTDKTVRIYPKAKEYILWCEECYIKTKGKMRFNFTAGVGCGWIWYIPYPFLKYSLYYGYEDLAIEFSFVFK
jgi:hypothetical protein